MSGSAAFGLFGFGAGGSFASSSLFIWGCVLLIVHFRGNTYIGYVLVRTSVKSIGWEYLYSPYIRWISVQYPRSITASKR